MGGQKRASCPPKLKVDTELPDIGTRNQTMSFERTVTALNF